MSLPALTSGTVAQPVHSSIAHVTVSACARLAARHGTETVVLAGGVFANRRLLESTTAGLEQAGLRTLTPERLPANDGGISYGQAAIAAAGMS